MTTSAPMSTFSDRLLALARPNLAWVSEQLDLFDRLVPHGVTHDDLEVPTLWRSGVTLRAHMLGSYALNGTWLWAWGNEGIADTPGAARSRELRELGEREEIPELTTRMLDFTGFRNPRLAADHLLLICSGLLDARGSAVVVINERGRAFLIVDDPAVPRAEPRADRLKQALLTGPAMLPGPALKSVQGWFARHGIEPEYAPGQVSGALPGGDRVTIALEGDGITAVDVTGPDGGTPRSSEAPEQTLVNPSLTPGAHADRLFPDALLPVTARHLAPSIRATREMAEYAGEHLGARSDAPVWDEDAGELRYPDGGLAARALGAYDLDERWFQWAPGTEDLRAALREAAEPAAGADVPELGGERLDLTPYLERESVAVALARTAASVAGHVFTSLGNRFYAVTDERLPAPRTDPAAAAEEIKWGASWLHPITPADARARTMRSLAESYFDRFGLPVWYYGQPDFISGVMGLYEVRVFFAPDGTITDTSYGLTGASSFRNS